MPKGEESIVLWSGVNSGLLRTRVVRSGIGIVGGNRKEVLIVSCLALGFGLPCDRPTVSRTQRQR